MFAKIFRRCKDDAGPLSSSSKLQLAFEKLEKKEIILQEKIAVEFERAKEFTKAKNRPAALQCLMRKKFYEGQIEHLESFQLLIHEKEQKLRKQSSVIGGQQHQINSNVPSNFDKNSAHTTLHSALKLASLHKILVERMAHFK